MLSKSSGRVKAGGVGDVCAIGASLTASLRACFSYYIAVLVSGSLG